MSRSRPSRRAFLRGLGACVALPGLESLAPAAFPAVKGRPLAVTPGGMPLRAAFLGFPNGCNYARWLPKGEGKDYALNETFAPMEPLKGRFQIVTGLAHDAANDWGDGPGDHARSGASFLTGCHAWKTGGAKLRLGISVDQVAARKVGHLTRIDSLQLGTEAGRLYGSCDTGYACAYQYNLSWANENLPLPPEANPRAVFEKLFGGGAKAAAAAQARIERRKSVLDFVQQDAKDLSRSLGRADRAKVEEYLAGVRRIEEQVQKYERFRAPEPGKLAPPEGIPDDYPEHLALMYDLLSAAFQTDSTRVVSFAVAPEGANRAMPHLGIAEGYHFLTHHAGNREKIAKVAKIERWYMGEFAKFLAKLDAMKEADGSSVLDNTMVVYGCAIGDGNKHNHDDLPVVLAGGGGGSLRPGRHLKVPRETPMTNLFVSLLDRMGVEAERVGDSTGRLDAI
ncbi:MAG: DUF1552 domain-containing protein [Gemmataceae bacterium]|nr:DUF1552 domain-containing protein [Gemmataceae bacterium]